MLAFEPAVFCRWGAWGLPVDHVLAVVRALVDAGDGVLLDEPASVTAIRVRRGQEDSGRREDQQTGERDFLHYPSIRENRKNLSGKPVNFRVFLSIRNKIPTPS